MDKLEQAKYIILTFGIFLLLIASFLFYQSLHPFKDSQETNGHVVQPSSSLNKEVKQGLIVSFKTLWNQNIELHLSQPQNLLPLRKGQSVPVIYSESEPGRAILKPHPSLTSPFSILADLGSAMIFCFLLIHLKDFKKQRKVRYLQNHGIEIKTVLRSVEVDPEHESNGKKPYRIYTEWLNPSATALHIFKSDYLLFDPSEMLEDKEVTVLIKKDNPSEYYLDLSFLSSPKKAPNFKW
ncbi:DUF3592 domain-containing protein [Marinomonas sp. PE14-40]|uniref:DUF3592 domain-containing protein n=1 Tax=Marinomonas sp. PE14-40 TaxID=3060621 RepID=UPI003F67F6BA